MKPTLYITRPDIPTEVVNLLKGFCDVEIWNEKNNPTPEIVYQKIQNKTCLFITSSIKVNKDFLDAAGTQLKVISTMSAGCDHIDLQEVKKRGIRVGNTPGVLDDAVAELTIALLLATTRRLFEGRAAILEGQWKTWSPWNWLNGIGLKNSIVGIFGFGGIGQEVARRLKTFKVKELIYNSRSVKPIADELGVRRVTFDQLLVESDILILLCSLTPETTKLFGAEQFRKMKTTAVVINTSRGLVVDQDALIDALKSKTIAAAGLDVMTPEPLPPDHPLLTLPNCVVIPHIGSAVWATRYEMAQLCADNIICALENKPMPAEL